MTKISAFTSVLLLASLSMNSIGLSFAAEMPNVISTTDVAPPSDVENLRAVPGDSQVTLTWDPTTDNVRVTGYYIHYGLTSVQAPNDTYTFGSEDVGDTTSAVIDNLSNDLTYYFAVTAYDGLRNESSFFSNEVSATPTALQTGDFTAPRISAAEAFTGTLVELEFSEPVVLPANPELSVYIESTAGEVLEIMDVYSGADTSKVFVVTAAQTAGAQYVVTAGADIEDLAGNPIVSGTSDTALFTGTSNMDMPVDASGDDLTNDLTRSDSATFTLEELEVVDLSEITLFFSEDISFAEPENFSIQEADDASETIEVLAVSQNSDDPKILDLLSEEMSPGVEYILNIDEDVLNTEDESLSEDSRSMEFTAVTLDLADLIAPEDISNLLSKISGEDSVMLTWTASLNSAGDLARYIVYQSNDGGKVFGTGINVAKTLTSYEAKGLTPGSSYTFKVSAIDENGNESEGVLTNVTLPETGPGIMIMLGLSLGGAAYIGRIGRTRKEQI